MEQDFAERLKRYRKEKNMTQQDLADVLGVSNKTVSRWESGGGYPDVPLLAPLALALGVTVDDLLDRERPIRDLTRQDWQNLLSFAFAMGGGVLYFLLKLFVPSPVCYLGYLGCMAYGVYLQRYYSYQSKWFLRGNLVMNFFVNMDLVVSLLVGGISLATLTMGTGPTLLAFMNGNNTRGIAAAGAVVALVLTAIAALLVNRYGFGKRLTLRLCRPTVRFFTPALCMAALTAFWPLYMQGKGLNAVVHFYVVLSALVLLCVVLFLKRGRRGGLVPTAALGMGGLLLPRFVATLVYLENSGRYVEDNGVISQRYPRLFQVPPELLVAGGLLVLLCLALALIRVEEKTEGGT